MQFRSSLSLVLTMSALFFVLTSSFTCSGSKEAVVGNKTGNLAPEILCDGLKGDCYTLSSLQGKLVLVEFWTAASDICRDAHFEMGRMYNTYKDQVFENADGFTIYSVSLDDSEEKWLRAIKEDRCNWPYQLCDPRKWNAPSVLTYEINSLPKYFLIDGNGVILNRYVEIPELEGILKDLSVR